MEDCFSEECINKYLKIAKFEFPNIDESLLKNAIGQYLLIDIEGHKPDPNNQEFLNAQKEYNIKEY